MVVLPSFYCALERLVRFLPPFVFFSFWVGVARACVRCTILRECAIVPHGDISP
jgi:hypothetical protein